MALKSEVLRGNRRLEQAAAGPPSIKPLPAIEDPDAITRIQYALIELGFLPKDFGSSPLESLGIFGPGTEAAVKEFQKKAFPQSPSEWDGKVGRGTLTQLDARLQRSGPQPPRSGISVSAVSEKTGSWNGESHDIVVAHSVSGTALMEGTSVRVSFSRRLYRVEGTSINWFGVALPKNLSQAPLPLIYFTPTPHQGGAEDPAYDSWGAAWDSLFGTYIYYMGAQVAASTAQLALVIPFYRNAQTNDLGTFNLNWSEVVTALVGAALEDELFGSGWVVVRDRYSFDSIYTASFSNGWGAHSAFWGKGSGVVAATRYAIDLDGAAAKPPSIGWRPTVGIIYDNASPGRNVNPQGRLYHLGGRWEKLARLRKRYADFRQHWAVNQYMLYHALSQYSV